MKFVVINGSPRGLSSTSQIMAAALLQGAQAGGAVTHSILLAEKNIGPCRGCFACWLQTPGRCCQKDDMTAVLAEADGADVLVLVTPLYFDAMTSLLKAFMDRLVVKGNPYFDKTASGESRHRLRPGDQAPALVLMSNCGFPERSHFQALSLWAKRAALNLQTNVLAEIYTAQGPLLQTELPQAAAYRHWLERAGRELALEQRLSPETETALAQSLLPDEVYIANANRHFDEILHAAPKTAPCP